MTSKERDSLRGILGDIRSKLENLERGLLAYESPIKPTDDEAVDIEAATQACVRKKRYRTAEGAGVAATAALANGSSDVLRVYACLTCDGFHLTHVSLGRFVGLAG